MLSQGVNKEMAMLKQVAEGIDKKALRKVSQAAAKSMYDSHQVSAKQQKDSSKKKSKRDKPDVRS